MNQQNQNAKNQLSSIENLADETEDLLVELGKDELQSVAGGVWIIVCGMVHVDR